jgi:hypothetical protein
METYVDIVVDNSEQNTKYNTKYSTRRIDVSFLVMAESSGEKRFELTLEKGRSEIDDKLKESNVKGYDSQNQCGRGVVGLLCSGRAG